MRKWPWALALCCGLGWTATADAQRTSPFMGRVSPTTVVNRPIDTSNVVAPLSHFNRRRFSLSNLFRGFRTPSFPPIVGQSALPPPSAFPSTKYPNAFKPVKPVVPGS